MDADGVFKRNKVSETVEESSIVCRIVEANADGVRGAVGVSAMDINADAASTAEDHHHVCKGEWWMLCSCGGKRSQGVREEKLCSIGICDRFRRAQDSDQTCLR